MKNKVSIKIELKDIKNILILGGLLLYFLSFLDFENIYFLAPISAFLVTVLSNIGLTAFSAGLVSVIVEISSIHDLINSSIMRIISGNFPYEKFSEERLQEIHNQIAVSRCASGKMSLDKIGNSVYVLEDELLTAAEGMYYEYNKADYVIDHIVSEKVFRKKVEFKYEIINQLGAENKVSLCISLIHPSDTMTDDELLKKFKIKKFVLKKQSGKDKKKKKVEEDLTSVARNCLDVCSVEKYTHSLYKYELCFSYPLDEKVYSNEVLLVYEYDVPDYDIIQSYKLNCPSKILEHTITINDTEKQWELAGDAYTAFYFPPTDKEYEVVQSVPNSIRINFRDWALTGAGYMVTFLQK